MSDKWIESLQQASDNISKWPDWKKELAGVGDTKKEKVRRLNKLVAKWGDAPEVTDEQFYLLQHESAILINALRTISSPMYVYGPAWGMRKLATGVLKQVEATYDHNGR